MEASVTPNERLYAMIAGKPVDRPAVTPIFMAWAAHHVGHTYRDFYLDAQALAEAQFEVTRDFGTDQISAISDPWREASAYGMEFDYPAEGVGKPKALLITGPADVKLLKRLDIMASPRTRDRVEAVRIMAGRLGRTHSVLGWVEGPLAEYGDLRGVENTMMDLFDKPEMFLEAAEIIIENAVAFAREQIKAGADMIGVGDAAASLIGPDLYAQYVLPLEKRLFAGIHDAGAAVKLHICGNTTRIVGLMAQTGADIIDLDWMVDLVKARSEVGPAVTLAGNFDPAGVLLQGKPDAVAAAARKCLSQGAPRLVLQPGCEVPPGTPEANIRAFCPCKGTLLGDVYGIGS